MKPRDEHPGHLLLSDRHALFVGKVSDTSVHAHYAVQVTITLGRPFQLRTDAGSEECSAAIIPPRAPHAVQVREENVLLLYLDPTATPGEQVAASCQGRGVRTLRANEVADCVLDVGRHLNGAPEPAVVEALVHRIASALVPGLLAESRVDARIRAVLALLDDEHAGTRQLPDLAAHVGLSPGRLRHLFAEQLGISIRSYKRWARVRRAMTLLTGGASLTEVAHAANFTDAAHLSRACRAMFGITLSKLAENQIEVQ